MPRWAAWACIGLLYGQSYEYGNSWIISGAPYQKLLVDRDGVYRISAAQLNLSGVASASLRLFWRGQEVPIYVEDGGDGVFAGNDYLEFIGRRNDGEPDSVAYRHAHQLRRLPGLHGNPLMPLNHNDTSAYFLTWGGAAGQRLLLYQDPNTLSHPTQDWFWWRFVESFHNWGYWGGAGGLGVGGYEQHNNPMYIGGEGRGAGANPINRSYNLPKARPSAAPTFWIEASHASLTISGTISLEWQANGTPHLLHNQHSAILLPG